MICGMLFEGMNDTEMKEMKLPELMVPVDKASGNQNMGKTKKCEWTRIRYVLQTDIKGWIPSSVINAAMSHTNKGIMRDLRSYVMQQQLIFSY